MSRLDDEQQPGPAVEREPEPRLLTRPVPAETNGRFRRTRPGNHHLPERGLGAWAARLRSAREGRKTPRAASPRETPQRPARLAEPRRRWALWFALACFAIACIGALVMVLDLRHAVNASLPQLDGEAHLPGLHAPVTVTRDAQGVPSITATSLEDLLFAQGYLTASDRLFQMDGLRRHAAGDLAEILGSGLVEHDRRQRYLQIRAAADRAVGQLPPDQLAQLEAYARGVNTFIETHKKTLPVEFRMLAYKPAPWSPRDSLLVSLAMFQDLSTGFPQKLSREALSAHLPAALLPDLYPVGSWRDHPPAAQSRNITMPHEVEQIPLDPSQARLPVTKARPEELAAVATTLAGANRCVGCRAGSNNWAVGGAHTASGSPLLSNDMHLNLGIPDIWYEASLHADLGSNTHLNGSATGRLDVTGFTLPGVPFVIVGRNTRVAWGVTNLGADVQDLRVEHLRGAGDNTEYQKADGTWALATHHAERIHVRGGRDVTLDVISTMHDVGATHMETPLISPLYPSEQRALSLAWTAYDPTALSSPFLGVNTATDGASLVASLASFGGPTLNLVWANTGGHIGYHAIGRVPIRGLPIQHPRALPAPLPQAAPGTLPADGDDEGAAPAEGPQAALATAPHLVLSAYRPIRRRRFVPAAPARPGRLARRAPVPAPAPETPVLPTPQPLTYTLGSPISPVPVDALDASQGWSGYIGYNDLPAVTDPASGLLATANSRITPDDYPWAVANDWSDPFRTDRIVHLLSGRHDLTPADMLRVENDVHSDVNQAIGQRLAYALDHASASALSKDPKRLHQAADLLRDWDGNMSAGSPAAAVARSVRDILWPSLLVPQIVAHDGAGTDLHHAAALAQLYTWGESTSALELILQHQPAQWLPRNYGNWNDFLAAMTERGLLAAHAPADLATWQYGAIHTVELAHPLFGEQRLLSRVLGIVPSTGARPAPGDGTTIKQIGAHFGPSERFTADLSSPDAATGNITTGQSENPHSRWYLDQFAAWLAGTTFPLPGANTAAAHTLTLLPQ